MITLPLLPLWLAEGLSALLVLVFAWMGFRLSQRLTNQDPENPLWLFLNWLATALFIFACTHAVSHTIQDFITFYGPTTFLGQVRRLVGGFESIIYVAIATITLFFHRMQRLYRRIEADHRGQAGHLRVADVQRNHQGGEGDARRDLPGGVGQLDTSEFREWLGP